MSSGSGLSRASGSPVIGWTNLSRRECNAGRSMGEERLGGATRPRRRVGERAASSAANRIAEDRVTPVGEVHPDLVRSPGLRRTSTCASDLPRRIARTT
jgi:hypothetical protein